MSERAIVQAWPLPQRQQHSSQEGWRPGCTRCRPASHLVDVGEEDANASIGGEGPEGREVSPGACDGQAATTCEGMAATAGPTGAHRGWAACISDQAVATVACAAPGSPMAKATRSVSEVTVMEAPAEYIVRRMRTSTAAGARQHNGAAQRSGVECGAWPNTAHSGAPHSTGHRSQASPSPHLAGSHPAGTMRQ